MTDPATVLDLEARRYAAMLAKDAEVLDRLLDDRLRYAHSNGAIDDKMSYLDGIRSGRFDYRKIERNQEHVVAFDRGAAVWCRLKIEIVVNGAPRKVDSTALAIWAQTGGETRLVAVSSVPVQQG